MSGRPLTSCGACICYFISLGLNFLASEMGRKVGAYLMRLHWAFKETRHIKHWKEHLIQREYQYGITIIFVWKVESAGGASNEVQIFSGWGTEELLLPLPELVTLGEEQICLGFPTHPWRRVKLLWSLRCNRQTSHLLHSRASAELSPYPVGTQNAHTVQGVRWGLESETGLEAPGELLSP